MAKLYEIVNRGVKCDVKKGSGKYVWDGFILKTNGCGVERVYAQDAILFDNDWQLDEPSVDDVLRERGWDFNCGRISRNCQNSSALWVVKKPTDAAEMTRIIDFLESLGRS